MFSGIYYFLGEQAFSESNLIYIPSRLGGISGLYETMKLNNLIKTGKCAVASNFDPFPFACIIIIRIRVLLGALYREFVFIIDSVTRPRHA